MTNQNKESKDFFNLIGQSNASKYSERFHDRNLSVVLSYDNIKSMSYNIINLLFKS